MQDTMPSKSENNGSYFFLPAENGQAHDNLKSQFPWLFMSVIECHPLIHRFSCFWYMFGMILISLLSDRNNIDDKFRMFLPA